MQQIHVEHAMRLKWSDRVKRSFLRGALLAVAMQHAIAAPYKSVAQIHIGGEGGWDILTIDDAARRLYLSHQNKVVVMDIDANKVVGEITDTPGVHALVSVPKLERGFSSNGKEDKTSVV